MSNSINSVTLIGNLVRDAELKYTNSGMAISNFSIAVNRSKKQTDGNYVDEASFIDCTLFGKRAEALNQYLVKGQKIGVSGSLVQDRWTTDSGENRSKISVNVDNVELLGSKSDGGQSQGGHGNYQGQPQGGYGNQGYQNNNQGNQGGAGVPQF